MSCSLNHSPAREALLAYATSVCNPDEAARCWAWLGMTDAVDTLRRSLIRELALHDLSEGGFTLLAHVIRCEPAPAWPDDLGDTLDLTRSSLNTLLGRLEVSDLIRRERPDRGSRRLAVRVTPKGRQVFTQALKHHLAAVLRTMSVLDPQDIASLDRSCTHLRQPAAATSTL